MTLANDSNTFSRATCICLAIGGIVSCPSASYAQAVRGQVVEALSHRPIEFSDIVLISGEHEVLARTVSDAQGSFSITELPDTIEVFVIRANAMGYNETTKEFELSGENTLEVRIELEVAPVQIDSVSVSADRRQGSLLENGFVDRMEKGRGEFVTPGWIAERDPADLRRVFQMLPRTYLRFKRDGGFGPRRAVILKHGRRECEPIIYVDGARMPVGTGLDNLGVPIESLKAMEVYRDPAAAPAEYGGGIMMEMVRKEPVCGIVLIWTWASN